MVPVDNGLFMYPCTSLSGSSAESVAEGTLLTWKKKPGDAIAIDEILVEIEDREYRLKLERAEATRLKFLSELLLEKQFSVPERSWTAEPWRG